MIARKMIDDLEQMCDFHGIRCPSRTMLLAWMNQELAELTAKEQWDWAQVMLDPAVTTVSGTQGYDLPDNFGDNFVRYGDEGDSFLCKIDNGSNQEFIDYVSPVQFYSEDMTATANAKPTDYTLITSSNGRRRILLYPTPDGTYYIDGLYVPTDWNISDASRLPPVPSNCMVLKWAVAKRINPGIFAQNHSAAMIDLYKSAALQRRAQLTPKQ